MKKLLPACLPLLLLCVCAASAQRKPDREAAGLKGAVKSVRLESATRNTTAEGKTVESARILRSISVYDEQGNRLESTSFRHDGSVMSKNSYHRDAQGNSVQTAYDGDGKFLRKTVQLVDPQGKFTGFIFLGANDELQQRSVETRGANGRLSEQAVYDANGKLLYRNVFSYDGEGKQTEHAVYNASGNVTQKTVWAIGGGFHTMRYDERGNISFESISKASTTEATDAQGNWTEQRMLQKNTQNGHTEESVIVTYRTIEYYPPKKQ
jgi:YD repeat-containing protein